MAMNIQAMLCGSMITAALMFSFGARAAEPVTQSPSRATQPTAQSSQLRVNPVTAAAIAMPRPPAAVGCYTYSANAGGAHQWITVPCLSPQEAARIPHLGSGGNFGTAGISSTSALGIQSGNVAVQFPPGNWSLTDSGTGKTSFSVQMNTNGFNAVCQSSNPLPPSANGASSCVNGDDGWVQFTYQTAAFGASQDNICIWNVDITKQYYNAPKTWQSCLGVGKAGFWPANVPMVLSGSIDVTHHLITLTAALPWSTEWVSVVSPDWFSLCWSGGSQCSWTQISGTIYGYGNGSIATFGPNTQVQTSEQTVTFANSNNGADVYLGGQFGGTFTLESNNLTPYYFALPNTACKNSVCNVTFNSSDVPPK
jgi:hypothetical protein